MKAFQYVLLLILIGYYIAVPYSISGNVYYLDGKNGSDQNDGSFKNPWKTINVANLNLFAGDTVYFRAGAYTESIEPVNSGSIDAYIVYKSYECEKVSLVATYTTPCIQLKDKKYIVIDGFNMVAEGAHRYSVKMNNADNCIIQNNFLSNRQKKR